MRKLLLLVVLVACDKAPMKSTLPNPGGTDNPIYTSVTVNGAPGVFAGSGCVTLPGGGTVCGDNKGGVAISGLEFPDAGASFLFVDAGSLYVATSAAIDGGLEVTGGEVADFLDAGGVYVSQLMAADGGITAAHVFIGQAGGYSGFWLTTPALASTSNYMLIANTTQTFLSTVSLTGGTLYLGPDNNNNTMIGMTDTGVAVGGGTAVNFIGTTTCALSSQTCNAVLAGSDGNTHCTCSLDLASTTVVGCNVKADAGSVSMYGPATSTGVATAWCFGK